MSSGMTLDLVYPSLLSTVELALPSGRAQECNVPSLLVNKEVQGDLAYWSTSDLPR